MRWFPAEIHPAPISEIELNIFSLLLEVNIRVDSQRRCLKLKSLSIELD